jgi:transketolase
LNLKDIGVKSKERDYFILSKGHDVPALYSVLANLGIIDLQRLENHCSVNDNIYWHPNISIPGVEFHSGSLGHGLSVAMGIAYYHKINKMNNKIVVMMGDGELNEGSVWEGFLVASAKNLNNLTVIIDRNEFQANLKTEDLIPLEPIDNKIKSFGWNVRRINGHKFDEINRAFSNISNKKKPTAIIADTVLGKGLPSLERDPARAFYKESDVLILDEATSALDDETELAVMDAIEGFGGELTVIIIAHRLTTLKSCDKIVKFGKNYATQILSYDEVMKSNKNKGDIYVE